MSFDRFDAPMVHDAIAQRATSGDVLRSVGRGMHWLRWKAGETPRLEQRVVEGNPALSL